MAFRHQDLISERLATLWRIFAGTGRCGADACQHRFVPLSAPFIFGGLHLSFQGQAKVRMTPNSSNN
jgi:hypothetical protein